MVILKRMVSLDRLDELLDEGATLSFPGCQHSERLSLLIQTSTWINQAYTLYKTSGLKQECPITFDDTIRPVVIGNIAMLQFAAIPMYRDAWKRLCVATVTCESCIKRRSDLGVKAGSAGEVLAFGFPSQSQDLNGAGQSMDNGDTEPGPPSDCEEASQPDPPAELLLLARQTDGKVIQGRKAPALRSRTVEAYRFREEREMAVVKEFRPTFDGYHTGPTVEALQEVYKLISAAFEESPDRALWSTVDLRFCDHGYRRTTDSFHQFLVSEPSVEDQLEHFFPTPPDGVLDDWKRRRNSTNVDLGEVAEGTWKGRLPQSLIAGNDLVVWTLDQMVGVEAGVRDTQQSTRTYTTGTTESGSLIRLDIQESRERLEVEDIHISVDIDSILWITDRLRTTGAVNIHVLPYTGVKAPIEKHNHTYVNLYWPRTKADCLKGRVSSASQAVPTSTLPNTHFATLGKVEGRAEIYVVFPRMRHKHPIRDVYETKVPYEVEIFWLENLVYEALRVLDKSVKPYTDWATADMQYRHKGARSKTLLIASEHLIRVQETITSIIEKHEADDSYQRFGSFFFVMQILGIKVTTAIGDSWDRLWYRLTEQHQDLDWSYMEHPNNGELLVDIGFGFHPPDGSQLVGFWEMDALRLGFDYGGYARGTSHAVSTVSAIGGIHAEMTSVRRSRVHIAYRLSYNLPYEILRGEETRCRDGFFPLAEAYNVSKKYTDSLAGVEGAYDRNMDKELGVRDEYRCRARTVQRVLPLMREKVWGFTPCAACSPGVSRNPPQ